MYGQPPPFRRGGGGRGTPPPSQAPVISLSPKYMQNPNFFHPNPNLLQVSNFPVYNPNFQVQNPNFPTNQNPNFPIQNHNFPIQKPNIRPHQFPKPPGPNEALERIDPAVAKARSNLLASGESVSAWKVSQSALLILQADSWDSLGFQMQQVPSLHRLIVTEGKINAFIHCFVGVRRVTSLYDLEVAICENEGVKRFEELELGPLVRHPLVVHYFCISSDVTDVFKITSEQIVYCLNEFMDSHKGKEIKADELLDFIAKKRSVKCREKLNVRIQSLGMHITQIRQARRSENAVLQKCLEGLKKKSEKRRRKRHPLLSSQKKQLDDHFSAISQRINSFSSENEDFCGKHIRFNSSCSEDDASDNYDHEDNDDENDAQSHCKISSQNVKDSDRISSCPYPSAAEEMTRLGLKNEMDASTSALLENEMDASPSASGSLMCNELNGPSKRKRESENISCKVPGPHKLPKRDDVKLNRLIDNAKKGFSNQNEIDLSLANNSIKMFIMTWKEACRENNVAEVLERMLLFYKTRKRKKVKAMFSLYPYVGLLNVAVTSIKHGMWDSMYDTFQTFSQQGVADTISEKCTNYVSIEVEPAENDSLVATQHVLKCKHGVTVEDILKKISTYLEIDHDIQDNVNPSLEKKFIFLRKLSKCEFWMTEQFSVREFESLGYGEFFMFLEKHVCLLPCALQKCLTGDTCEKPSLQACMLQHQLAVLLSQASNILWENENLSKISELLARQFPSICFKLVASGSIKEFWDIVRENKSNVISNCVLFSANLLGTSNSGHLSAHNDKGFSETAGVETDIGHKAGTLGSVTAKDAIGVLLRAPMLTDLGTWSHWDLIFAPSLGPLVGWLLNEVNTKELLFLVTKGGKIIRIDNSATMDSFLEVFIQGSPFQTAVELLSLIALYGGEQNVPLSLMKCHARQAFEVIIKNFVEMELNDGQQFRMHGTPLCRQHIFDETASTNLSSELNINRSGINKAVPMASRFILECLGYLPVEFCSFSADILLSGLRSVVKDAPSAILNECKQTELRLMLHEVGLSLGILEWINDYHTFCSSEATDLFMSSGPSCLKDASSEFSKLTKDPQGASEKFAPAEGEMIVSTQADRHTAEHKRTGAMVNSAEVSGDSFGDNRLQHLCNHNKDTDPAIVIESIRREEFGLDPSLSVTESNMLKKQHARLGRALSCLSQELYSQDSHFLLELIQNADDNVYPGNVEPTLTFILLEKGIIVLNNEQGFSAENIRALCDVGNSTKKGSSAGYIGKKGIGFKSVFRVSDAPEIHSNGFHIKFDISEGQIGFVLPTVVPPCDIGLFSRLASMDTDQMDDNCWNTCVVLPFRSKFSKGFAMNNIISMFSDLHPSLLLFLHRLHCIKFRNMLDDSLHVMRKGDVGDGIIKVSLGEEQMTWLVVSQKLRADAIRPDVHTTEISIAFTLQESDNGNYIPHLEQQPVFAFLPLRKYGLKFILQGDFILPSSREEVDGDSPWNQWLLSEYPGLFVRAVRSFCGLTCFRENLGKAVAAFLSFVPLLGEVHGFFSSLPRMIISKLRTSNCLLLEGDNNEWVPPCKALRSWTEEARALLPDSLLREHLGLGFLNKDIVLSDSLARALGIEEYGPRILLQIISSLCRTENGIRSMGFGWLSSWLNTIYVLFFHSSGQTSLTFGTESDPITNLRKIPFIPLSDGKYGSVGEGTIWLHSDALSTHSDNEYGPEAFPKLYAKLRTVNHALFAAAAGADDISCFDASMVEKVTRVLYRVGVQRLSAHEIVKVHILPAISDDRNTIGVKDLMTEYFSFVMFHLQSSCSDCCVEREHIISELCHKALILTNHGYKRPVEVSIHFSKEFGNPIDVNKLISGIDVRWHEIDITYLKHPITKSVSDGILKWRNFFQELGITDFVRIVQTEKSGNEISHVFKNMMWDRDMISPGSIAKDWESEELVHLLLQLSSSGDQKRCKYLLEVLDTLWDDCFSEKVTGYCNINSTGESKPFKSSLISILQDVRWIASSMDEGLHYPKDLFHDCEVVRSILGVTAPYGVPKVRSEKLSKDIGFKTQVTLDDILSVLQVWRRSETPFNASISQMSSIYSFIWNEMAISKQKIAQYLSSGAFIFVPLSSGSAQKDVVPGVFMSPQEVFWHDPTGSMDQMNVIHPSGGPDGSHSSFSKMLCNVYPGLHDFFVNECGVNKIPPFRSYLQILLQLSTVALPSQAAYTVFQVFLKWSDGLKSGLLSSEDVDYLKESLVKKEFMVLPTSMDKWVSLHRSFGLVCWCDDEKLRKEFKHFDKIDFLYFGELSDEEKETLLAKVSDLMRKLGIPALSEVVTREPIYYGPTDSSFKTSLVNWALPYAQRYIYNAYPDKYFQLKQSGFENLSNLQIVVVEKLFYRNVIKRPDISSQKRFECSCLLQGNVLYTTRESDSHSIFLELSRLLVHGTPELHLANFLHMITTMAESGSTEEQTEFFILNSQKVPRLPDEESIWFLPSPSSAVNEEILMTSCVSTMTNEPIPSKSRRKPGINSNWPPVNWKTAPGFGFARENGLRTQASSCLQMRKGDDAEEIATQTDHVALVEINADWTIEDDLAATTPAVILHDSETLEDQSGHENDTVASGTNVVFDSVALVTASDGPNSGSFNSSERDQPSFCTSNSQQALVTGRLGELVAFKYFIGKVGKTLVKWVNEANETRLPYDIVVGDDEKSREYIEVKATKYARKDWFVISAREWQFAVEKGESFSIARVVLSSNNMARVTIYKNPVRLCHLGQLQLAVVTPKQQTGLSIVS